VAVGQLEHRAVTIGQPAGCLGDEIGEFGTGGQGVGARFMSHGVGQFIVRCFAAAFPESTQRFIAGDRIKPRAELVGFPQLR
jgi:hypothetical protein